MVAQNGETNMAGVTSESEEPVRPDVGVPPPLVLNELLCYVQYHIKRTVNDNIVEVIARHFSLEEIANAKDILKGNYSSVIGHILKERRTTQNKVKCVSISEDIVNALQELDARGIETNFVAKNLGRLGRHDAKDYDPYAVLEMVISLGDRLRKVEDSVGEATARIIMHEDGLRNLNDTMNTHELILSTQVIPKDPSYKEVVAGNFSDELSAGTSGNLLPQKCNDQDTEKTNISMNQDDVLIEHDDGDQAVDEETISEWIKVGRNGKPLKRPINTEKQKVQDKTQQGRRPSFKKDLHGGKRQRYRVHGSRQGELLEGAPLPKRDFFLSRVIKGTDDDVIKNYLLDKGIQDVELKVVSNVSAKYKSYKLSVNVDSKDKIMHADLWPRGICIQKWIEKRNRAESTDLDNGGG